MRLRALFVAALLALSAPRSASSESVSTVGTTTPPEHAVRDPSSDNSLRSSYGAPSTTRRPTTISPTTTTTTGAPTSPDDAPTCPSRKTVDHGLNTFGWEDYLVLGTMLAVSVGIGLFYAFFGAKQKTADDFLLGGSSMGTFPMAMSLAASFITAIELLGNPAEMYSHGTQFWMTCVSFFIVIPLASRLYLPVFMTLRLTSSYEYLQIRFNRIARLLASAMYIFQMTLYTSVAVYAPALALSHVTGLNTYVAVTLVYLVCIFYSSSGGMKAVIMTDTFQAAVLIGSIVLILGLGDSALGGTSVIWSHSHETQRIEFFNLSFDPTVRHSFWSVVIGGTFYWLSMFCANQASIQKYLSVEKISQVRTALWVSAAFLVAIFTINFYTGAILFAEYRGCDPVKKGTIAAADELLPMYVMEALGHMKGLPGFFVAGIFAASLGTVASALNSLTAVTMQDFVAGAFGVEVPPEKGAFYGKWVSVAFGVTSFCLVFVVEQLGSVLQVALTFNGMVGGVTLGLFSLGMFFPWANAKGAVTGAVVAFGLVLWIGLGAQVAFATNQLTVETLYLTTECCPLANATVSSPAESLSNSMTLQLVQNPSDNVLWIYKLSYLWYSVIGTVTTVVVGMVVSILTTPNNPSNIHPDLLSPPICSMLGIVHKEKMPLPIPEKDMINNNAARARKTSKIMTEGIINVAITLDDEDKPPQYPALHI